MRVDELHVGRQLAAGERRDVRPERRRIVVHRRVGTHESYRDAVRGQPGDERQHGVGTARHVAHPETRHQDVEAWRGGQRRIQHRIQGAEPGQQPRRRYVAVDAPRGGAAHRRNRLRLRHLAEPASFVRSGQRVMLEGIESRIAHVRVDLEVAGWIEFRARLSTFGRTEANVVSERREARGGNVWISEQVVSGVEREVHPMALAPAIQHVMHNRIQSGGADVRIATQVVHRVEQRRGPSPLARAAR